MTEVAENVKVRKKQGKNMSIDRASKQSWNTHRTGMAQRVGMKGKDNAYTRSEKQSLVPVDQNE